MKVDPKILQVHLNPKLGLSTLPLSSFYRFALPVFETTGEHVYSYCKNMQFCLHLQGHACSFCQFALIRVGVFNASAICGSMQMRDAMNLHTRIMGLHLGLSDPPILVIIAVNVLFHVGLSMYDNLSWLTMYMVDQAPDFTAKHLANQLTALWPHT